MYEPQMFAPFPKNHRTDYFSPVNIYEDCPKCGNPGGMYTPKYVPENWPQRYRGLPVIPEHINWICSCGYCIKQTRTRDNP